MGMMFFVEGAKLGSGSVFKVMRPKGSLVVDYEYIWNGQHVVGSFHGTRTMRKVGPNPWSGAWNDVTPGGVTLFTGTALLVEAAWGRTHFLTGEWGSKAKTPSNAWFLVLP